VIAQGVSRSVKTRAYVATTLVTLLLGGVAWKAWALQVEDNAKFRQRALRQHVHTVEIPAPRGAILDARDRPLAVSADAESIYVNPGAVVDVVATSERLAELLGVDASVLEARLSSRKHFAWIARHVTPQQAAAVRAADLPGVDVTAEPRRWYPGKTSGGPLIGFSGIDGNGLDGLELRFDKLLTGQRARFDALRDARGKTAAAEGVVDAVPGATVSLTIDRAIQQVADEALAKGIEEHQAKSGVVIVLDVKTGAVLAMASHPTYDPNEPGDAVKAGARNRAVTDVFEIGSVMKVFTVAAALDAGVTRPDEWWDVENGSWFFAGKPIRDTHHDPVLTTSGIIKRSSNVGIVKLGIRLGRERLYQALARFGFGARTGIELPHEEPGTMRNGSKWRDIELATITFGYGMTVTPLQVAAAMAAIGDDGRWHTPHVVARVVDASGAVVYEPTVETRQIMSERTAQQLRPMLASVFEKSSGPGKYDGGTAAKVVIDGFRAGGKTATAHKLDPATKRYADKLYLSSFAGIAPIDDPRIAVVVVIDEPSGKEYFGGKVAGPVFATVVSETLKYLGVPGEKTIEEPRKPEAPKKKAKKADRDEDEGVDVMPIAEPPPSNIPDFRGMSIARALAVAREAGVAIDVVGSGRAVAQEAIGDGAVRVTFERERPPPPDEDSEEKSP
jgi:cell division protein FtsI (penicillin-binding protein 3)